MKESVVLCTVYDLFFVLEALSLLASELQDVACSYVFKCRLIFPVIKNMRGIVREADRLGVICFQICDLGLEMQ